MQNKIAGKAKNKMRGQDLMTTNEMVIEPYRTRNQLSQLKSYAHHKPPEQRMKSPTKQEPTGNTVFQHQIRPKKHAATKTGISDS